MKKPKIALCLIARADDSEAPMLRQCLSSVAAHVDGIFVTVTGKNKKVEDVVKFFGGTVSHFKWVNHFAKARNYNFSRVPKEYTHIFWLDTDDVVRGVEKLRPTIEDNPHVDCFSMFYLYAFDEHKNPIVVHQKTRVVKNDGCVSWEGALHEDFKEHRNLSRFFIKGIEVLHMTTDQRVQESMKRNVEVATIDAEANPDDPRSYWNLGNSLKMNGQNEAATEALEKFLGMSESDSEKYIVYLRLAEIYFHTKDFAQALDRVRYAVGVKPEYPDAYHMMGHIYFDMGRFERAKESYIMGLSKKPPYHEIIAYNPRDYDYVPLMALAKTYFNLSMPVQALTCLEGCAKITPQDKNIKKLIRDMKKEVTKFERILEHVKKLKRIKNKNNLKKALDNLPEDIQSHPIVCNIRNVSFTKKESSGRDLVFYCGYTVKKWDPDVAKSRGVGGSEEAIINLSRELSDLGWNVTVYNHCGHKEQKFGKVTYKPYWTWNYRDKQDVVVLWRSPKAAEYDINAPKVFIDLHDVIEEDEFTLERMKRIDKIFVKSQFHRSLFPGIPNDMFVVVPNGIVAKDFTANIERDPYLLLNTSSPDRSLGALLDCFEEVQKQVPEAKLKWAYGWGVFDVVHGDSPRVMEWKQKILAKIAKMENVEALGMVNHREIARLYLKANILAYPTEFAEIDCISARKAQAAGCIPVTSDFSALNETVQFGVKVHSEKTADTWCAPYQYDFSLQNPTARAEWVRETVRLLKTPINEKERSKMRKWAQSFDWSYIASVWNKEL